MTQFKGFRKNVGCVTTSPPPSQGMVAVTPTTSSPLWDMPFPGRVSHSTQGWVSHSSMLPFACGGLNVKNNFVCTIHQMSTLAPPVGRGGVVSWWHKFGPLNSTWWGLSNPRQWVGEGSNAQGVGTSHCRLVRSTWDFDICVPNTRHSVPANLDGWIRTGGGSDVSPPSLGGAGTHLIQDLMD